MGSLELADRKFKDALKVLALLEQGGYQARMAGGSVRDRLLGKHPMDYDVATTGRPEEVMAHAKSQGVRSVPTGLAHGTVTLIMPSGPVEVTTLRCDVKTDGRHAEVAFTDSFEADASRRDFTINAMFEDRSGTVSDFFSGKADLKAGILRFVGEPALRLSEDYLRLMRFFRFWARFPLRPATGTVEAITAAVPGLGQISQERITSELLKTFAEAGAAPALAAMVATGTWQAILPELAPPGPQAWPDGETATALGRVVSAQRGLGALGLRLLRTRPEPSAKEAEQLGKRLRLSGDQTKRLARLCEARDELRSGFSDDAAALDFVERCDDAGGKEAFAEFYQPLFGLDESLRLPLTTAANTEARCGHRRLAKLPLTGDQVAAHLGIEPSAELGKILAKLRRSYRNGAWSTAAEGIAWLNQHAKAKS